MLIHDNCQFHHVQELLPHANGGQQLERFPASVHRHLDGTRGRWIAQHCAGCEIRTVSSGPVLALTLGAPGE